MPRPARKPDRLHSDLAPRVRAVLEEIRRFSSFGAIFFQFDAPAQPVIDRAVCRFCVGCVRHARAGGLCQSSAHATAVQGYAIGDVWYSRCWLGVDCFVVPIAPEGELLGALEVGGYFTPGETDRSQERVLGRLASVDSRGTTEEFVSGLQGMREIDFLQVRAAAEFVLEATFAKGLNQSREFRIRRNVFRAQQRLSESQRQPSAAAGDPLRVTESLMAMQRSLVTSDLGQTPRLLDEYLAALFVGTVGDVTKFKGGLLPFVAFIAQLRLQRGGTWHAVLGAFDKHVLKLEQLQSVQEACAWAETLLLPEAVTSLAGETMEPNTLAARVTEWIRKHHAGRVRLEDAARAVGASRSSLVHRLKRETGQTFNELLSTQRICEAKRLLAFSNLTIGEVSRRCGFRDQSYFTKVFQGHINLTPREFRRLLALHQAPESAPHPMNLSDVTALLSDLVRIDSRTPGPLREPLPADAVTEQAMAQFTAARLAEMGFQCRIQEAAPRRPNLVAWAPRVAGRRTLAMEAHFDTVGSEGMTHAPLVPEIRNGRLYARGAADTKGSLAAMLAALAQLQAEGAPVNLLFLGACAEETGCEGVRHFDLREFALDGVIVGEPTGNRLISGHKGHAWFGLEALGKAAHGSCPDAGDNAIYRMARAIDALRRLADGELRNEGQEGFTPCTLTVNRIHGGTKVNIIPERCTAEIDLRLVPRLAPEPMLAEIMRRLQSAEPAGTLQLAWSHLAPGLHLPGTHPLGRALQQALQARGRPTDPGTVNYCTDAGVLASMGIPALVFGPGSILQAHAAEEFIDLMELQEAVGILVTAARAFATA